MIERVLDRIQALRYGNVGVAIASGLAIFSLAATVTQVAGVNGNALVLLIVLNVSTFVVLTILLYLNHRQYKQELDSKGLQAIKEIIDSTALPSRTIGVAAPLSYWATDYYVHIIKAIRGAAERERREVQRKVVVLDVPHEELHDVEQTLADAVMKRVAGLILINMRVGAAAGRDLLSAGTPVVSVTHESTELPTICSILPDHSGFDSLLRHLLLEKQSQAAVYLTKELANPFKGIKVDPIRKEKLDLFLKRVVQAGLKPQPSISFPRPDGLFEVQPGRAYVLEADQYAPDYGSLLLQRLRPPIPPNTAFIFLADVVAIDFMIACARSGATCMQRKFRVTGFDNSKAAEWHDLSSVDYQLDIVGRLAYERIQTALDHPGQLHYARETVETVPVIRRSSNW